MTKVKYDDLLPNESFAYHNVEGFIVKLKKGETGFYKVTSDVNKTVDELNEIFEVTKEQAEAMYHASMFDWNIPASNPQFWKEQFEEKGDIVFHHNKIPQWLEKKNEGI